MAHRGTPITRLKKVHAERMMDGYDADPITALTSALRIILDMPGAEWAALLAAAPIDDDRRRRLLEGDETTLDQLAAELNERRSFDTQR